jgi:hypothetical protein
VQVVPVHDLDGRGGGGVVLRSQPRGPAAQEVEEDPCFDGLGQRGQGAGGLGLGADGGCRVGGDDDEPGAAALVTQPAEHRRTALARHLDVGDDEVGVVGRGLAECVVGTRGFAHLPPAEAEQAGDPAACVGLVVDDQGGQHRNQPVAVDSLVQP